VVEGDSMMQALANSAAFWVLAVLVLAAVYLMPTVVGTIRGVDQLALVFLVNLIGAPTGIGWLAALILAFGPRRLPPGPPPASPPPSW
jgi:Superinfection immunity protein